MSTETNTLIVETARRIFEDLCSKEVVDNAEKGEWPTDLWDTLEESGLTLAAFSEESGGSGGSLSDSMAVIKEAARHAAPIPLAETFLAGWLLESCGQPIPSGPLTVGDTAGLAEVEPGVLCRVPWAATAGRIVVPVSVGGNPSVLELNPGDCEIEAGASIAGEPRDCVRFQIEKGTALPTPDGSLSFPLREMGALCRSVQMAGALEHMLDLTIEHAKVRVQFGRPIASFQAIRQLLAQLAGHVAVASTAAEAAVDKTENGNGSLAIAVAKARVGEATGKAAETAHQIHGAMGTTYEHSLHQYSRRVWSWRDEFGGDTYWQERIGSQVADRGADELWAFVTENG